jgi:hypothetical protein
VNVRQPREAAQIRAFVGIVASLRGHGFMNAHVDSATAGLTMFVPAP